MIGFWSIFFLQTEILILKFFFSADFGWWVFRSGRLRKRNFWINHILEENFFRKNWVWVLLFWRSQVMMKNSHLNKFVLTQFIQQKTTNFSFFVPILQGMFLTQSFSLKIGVSNEIFWKKESDSEANFLL